MRRLLGLAGKHGDLLLHSPHILPRLASNYARLLILGRPVLRGVELAVTNDCNAECEHCSSRRLMSAGGEVMDLATLDRVLAECLRLGALNINLTGGEPLLRPDLFEIIRLASPGRTVVTIATNGTTVTADMAAKLKRAGVRILSVGLDSADPATHDARKRRPGSFQRLREGVDLAKRGGLDVYLCTIVTRENLGNGDVGAMIALAKEWGCKLTLNLACAVGNWGGREDVVPGRAEIEAYRDMLRIPHVRWEGGSNYLKDGCPAGAEKIYVTATGEVTPCTRAHISFGNVRNESLAHIWERMRKEGPFREIRKGCPVAEDPDFIRDYIEPIRASGRPFLPFDELAPAPPPNGGRHRG